MLHRRAEPLRLHRLDRLPALALVAALGVACQEKGAPPPAALSRFDAVKAAPGPAPSKWCDLAHPGADAPALALPPSEPPAPATPPGRWTWVNLWATWCTPCVRELPLLQRWHDTLVEDGVNVDTWLVSLDEDAPAAAKFLGDHRELKPAQALRLKDPASLEGWLRAQGLEATSSIPIHALVAPDGKVRCVRAGSLAEGDYHLARAVMRGN